VPVMNADLIRTIVLSILPVSELRGAIPYAVYKGFSIPIAAIISIAANICIPIIAFLFLESLHRLLYKIPQYKRFFDRVVNRARAKVHTKWKNMAIGVSYFLWLYPCQQRGCMDRDFGCMDTWAFA